MSEIVLPKGFRFAGVVSGLRTEPNRRDVGVIVSDHGCAAAGVFTQNRVCAAPVQVSKARLPHTNTRAIVVCSGNANACTGEQGLTDAKRMTEIVATDLGVKPEQVLVASTGVIGRPLPMSILEAGIPKAVAAAKPDAGGFDDFAHSILTTDTKIKSATVNVSIDGAEYTVLGVAKGAAMIGPNMATMLGFLVTDAGVPAEALQLMLRTAVNRSFNRIAVEGHTSTNDCVLILSNGTTPVPEEDHDLIAEAINDVCAQLAEQIIYDAEGANHIIRIIVEGCRTDAEADTIARAVAGSALVKTAVFGHDPNWGRVVSAAGFAGVMFDEKDLSLTMGDLLLYDRGTPLPFDAAEASQYLKDNHEVVFHLKFALGDGECTFLTSDLTVEYVKLNADYTT
ncbi:bifunctional glutamate N-acetyltransferase/amino-acid acetyltransferase ArgJ [soil metagenome]